jgi:hypothetical protein
MSKFYSYYFEEICVVFFLSEDRMAASPSWEESSAFPPLPPRLAIQASRQCLKDMLREFQLPEPEFYSCALRRQGKFEGSKWYYVVSWMVAPPDSYSDWASIDVPVFMSGDCPRFKVFPYDDRLVAWSDRTEP